MKAILHIFGIGVYLLFVPNTVIGQEYLELYEAENYAAALAPMTAAAKAGDADAQFYLAKMYSEGLGVEHDYEEMLRLYKLAARQNHPKAISNIGYLYYTGKGVLQDYGKAKSWWLKASALEHPTAQYNLGLLYENGQGVEQDYEKAVQFYRMAANQDYAHAQNQMGIMYEHGNGVEQDYAKALSYYKLAAEQGNKYGLFNIGDMYEDGTGVEKNCSKAMIYYDKATKKGHDESKKKYNKLFDSGCRMLASESSTLPTPYDINLDRYPVFEWTNPSVALAEKMETNATYRYFDKAKFTPTIIKNELKRFRKGKNTDTVFLIQKGSYTKLSHVPTSGYGEWTLPDFMLPSRRGNNRIIPCWHSIKMKFFLNAGASLADFSVPLQFRTSLSPANEISIMLYKDGTFGLITADNLGNEMTCYISKKSITAAEKTTLEYLISTEGQWKILVDGKLFGQGTIDSKDAYSGLSNKFWFEGDINIVSLTINEYFNGMFSDFVCGLPILDIATLDANIAESLDRFIHFYDLEKEYIGYDTDEWTYESHERTYLRRTKVSLEDAEYTIYSIGLIVSGKNVHQQSISIPLQYEMQINEEDKSVETVYMLFNGQASPYIMGDPEANGVLKGYQKEIGKF